MFRLLTNFLCLCDSPDIAIHFLDPALQQTFRDLFKISTHAIYDPDVTEEQYHRARLGLLPSGPLV